MVAINHTAGEALLAAAEDCARALGARVVLLHVLRRHNARHEASARAYLDTLVAHFATRGITAEPVIGSGKLVPVILEEARSRWIAAIVIGASQRPALLRSVVGSVSSAVERGAPCPVLLVERDIVDAERPQALRSFNEAAERVGPLTRRLPRLEIVDVTHIVGSVGRARELEADFRPPRSARRRSDEDRLQRVYNALESGKGLPPVDLYKLGSGYYVLDGHHRVAAALLIGQAEIDAVVVEHLLDTGS
ncbi:MAG TPA: universal stress protein [Chloroflexota bacterium]